MPDILRKRAAYARYFQFSLELFLESLDSKKQKPKLASRRAKAIREGGKVGKGGWRFCGFLGIRIP